MNKNHSVFDYLREYYHNVLLKTKSGEKALHYLLNRGINEEMIKKFRLGYSPANSKSTIQFLKKKGFGINELIELGILKKYESGQYKGKVTDPFKNRVIFPLNNENGKTLGFAGRALDENNKIKYYNSPESDLFKKGNLLYGLDVSADSIQKYGFAILFEGYFDCIAAHQFGITNSIATMGTALTQDQAALLKKVTNNVVIVFDGDDAGINASFRTAALLKNVGCNVKIAYIPEGLDPDDYLKKYGSNQLIKKVIGSAKPIHLKLIEYKKSKHDLSSPNGRYDFASDVISEVTLMGDREELRKTLRILEGVLNISLKTINEEIQQRV